MVNGPEDDLLAWNAIDWQACKEKSGCGSGSSRRPEQEAILDIMREATGGDTHGLQP